MQLQVVQNPKPIDSSLKQILRYKLAGEGTGAENCDVDAQAQVASKYNIGGGAAERQIALSICNPRLSDPIAGQDARLILNHVNIKAGKYIDSVRCDPMAGERRIRIRCVRVFGAPDCRDSEQGEE